jgi:hypothetical protein
VCVWKEMFLLFGEMFLQDAVAAFSLCACSQGRNSLKRGCGDAGESVAEQGVRINEGVCVCVIFFFFFSFRSLGDRFSSFYK